jgi:hypothetical protein
MKIDGTGFIILKSDSFIKKKVLKRYEYLAIKTCFINIIRLHDVITGSDDEGKWTLVLKVR